MQSYKHILCPAILGAHNLLWHFVTDLKRHSQAFLLAARYISPEYQEEVEALLDDLGLEYFGAEQGTS